jgi:hypothetical protein
MKRMLEYKPNFMLDSLGPSSSDRLSINFADTKHCSRRNWHVIIIAIYLNPFELQTFIIKFN